MFLTLITFIFILGLLVFVHELGHFVTAKRAGVKIEEFGFGFPPRAFGFYKDENNKWKLATAKTKDAPTTVYSLNWVPLGGFVKIKGEDGSSTSDEDSFASKSPGKRAWIISAGVLMNMILAAVLLSIGFYAGLPQLLEDQNLAGAKITEEKIRVVEVIERLPAQKYGVQMGDTLVSLDGEKFNDI